MPSFLLHLARKGLLTKQHLTSQDTFLREIYGSPIAIKEIKKVEVLRGIESEFAEAAAKAWGKRNKLIAIVLLATAVEQIVNMYHRLLLAEQDFSAKEITDILKSVNLQAKVTWLLKLSTERSISLRLQKKVKKISEIRNAIVHFKAENSLIDEDKSSADKIEEMIKELGRLNPSSFLSDLEFELQELTRQSIQAFDLVLSTLDKINEWKFWDALESKRH